MVRFAGLESGVARRATKERGFPLDHDSILEIIVVRTDTDRTLNRRRGGNPNASKRYKGDLQTSD